MKLIDKLVNVIAGLGTSGDKASHTVDVFRELGTEFLSSLYASNWMIGTIVDAPVDDMLRKPRIISAPSLSDADWEKIEEQMKIVSVREDIDKLLRWGRLYGGAALVLGITGTGEASTELRIESIKQNSLQFIHVLNKNDITIGEVGRNPLNENYLKPLYYRLPGGGTIHASRVIPIMGVQIPDSSKLKEDGWGMSDVNRSYEPVMQTQTILAQMASMTFEANIDVIAVKGLSAKLATTDGENQVINRFRVGNVMKSTHQMLLLDQDTEEYTRNPIQLGKFPDLLPQYFSTVSGSSGIPATKFMGKSPDGMNATGEGDEKNYFDMVEGKQKHKLSPIYDRLDPIILMSALGKIPDDWTYEYPPLFQVSKKEQSEIDKTDSETIKNYYDMGVVGPWLIADKIHNVSFFPAMDENYVKELKDIEESEDVVIQTQKPEEGPTVELPEERPDEVAPTQPKPVGEEKDVQKQALNGAQIASMVDIAAKVAKGELSQASAIAIIMVAIPGISEGEAKEIAGEEGTAPPPAQPTPPVPPTPPQSEED